MIRQTISIRGMVFLILFFSVSGNIIAQRKKKDIEFSISSRIIEKGDSVGLAWSVRKADSVELVGIERNLPLTGSYIYYPDTTVILELKCWINKGSSVSKKRKVNVVVPEIQYFKVPESITDEEEIELKWRAEHAEYVRINHVSDSLGLTGNVRLYRDTTSVFTIYAVGRHNSVELTDTVQVRIKEDAKITKRLLYRGDTLKIMWKTKRSKGVFFKPGEQIFPSTGYKIFRPKRDTTIVLSVARRYGITDTLASFKLTVMEPYISYFWGENSMLRGDKSVLTWNVNGGDSISIIGLGNELPGKGLMEVSPDETTTYTLRVKDGESILTREWKINVYPFRKYISSIRHIDDVPRDEPLEMDIIGVDRSKYPDEMTIRVVVVDTSGNYISGMAPPLGTDSLSKVYFKRLSETTDNNNYTRSYHITEIQESASTPYDISLVLDYSGSMVGTIDYLEKSLKRFILRKYLNDRISITKFDEKINTVVPLLSNSEEIFDYFKFEKLAGFGGKTALYAAADMGLTAIDSSDRKKVMILFTDGNENSSFLYFGQYAFTANQLAERLRLSGTRLFVVSYGTGTNTELLLQLASLSDGKIYFISSPEYITKVFDEMPRVLHQYYEISYTPVKHTGNHRVILNYYNHTRRTGTVYFDYYIGSDFDISDMEFDTANYWFRMINGKKPVSPPQVVVNFVFNEDFIRQDYLTNLEKYLKYLQTYPETEVEILAHADHIGTDEQCLIISQRRAGAVKSYFLSQGIDEKRIHIRSFGKIHPIWITEEETWKASENRRVELILYE
jgi:Mg-chelatase subunit ChlD